MSCAFTSLSQWLAIADIADVGDFATINLFFSDRYTLKSDIFASGWNFNFILWHHFSELSSISSFQSIPDVIREYYFKTCVEMLHLEDFLK